MRKELPVTTIEVISLFVILFLSIRSYLLGSGFYEYADQYWSILPGINSFASFNPDAGFIFTRTIISWPVYFFLKFPSFTGEKITIIYLIGFYLALIYISITVIRSLLERAFHYHLNNLSRLLFFYIAFLFVFSNLESQNLFVDGGMITDNIIMVLMVLSVFLIVLNVRLWFLEVASFISFTILLDPDYLLMFLVLALVVTISSKINGVPLRSSVPKLAVAIFLTIPVLEFIIFNINVSTGAFLLHSTGLRIFSPGDAIFYSRNLNLLSVLSLNGHNWSTMVFTSPDILLHLSKLGILPGIGDPIDILVIGSPIFYAWYISLFLPLILSILNIFYPRTRSLFSTGIFLMVVSVILVLYAHIPPLLTLFSYLPDIPIAGTYISTALSLPAHFLILVSVSYATLIILFIFNLLSHTLPSIRLVKHSRKEASTKALLMEIHLPERLYDSHNQMSKKISGKHAFISILVILILLFSGWQILEGNFFPARDNAFGPTLPNGLVNSAPFSPRVMSQDQLTVYHFIYDQNGSFSIYWPAIEWPSGQGWVSPKPQASLPYIGDLIKDNLTNDTYYYLRSNDVRYVVIQNNSDIGFTSSYPNLLEEKFGLSSYRSVLNFFDADPNFHMILGFPGIAVYSVNTSDGIQSYIPLSVNPDGGYSSFYDLFGSMGMNAVIFNNQKYTSAGISKYNANIDVIPPNDISKPSEIKTFLYNGTYSENVLENKFNKSNYTFTNWGSNYSSFLLNGSKIAIEGQNSSISSISYNGNIVSHPGGFAVGANKKSSITVSFTASSIRNVSYLSISWFYFANGTGNEPNSIQLNGTTGYKQAEFSFNSGFGNAIGARIMVVGNNYSITIQKLSYGLTVYQVNGEMPFGETAVLSGENNFLVNSRYNYAYLLLNGTGEVSDQNYTSYDFGWYTARISGDIELKGNYQIAAVILTRFPLESYEITGYLMDQYVPYLILKNSTKNVFPVETVNRMAFYHGSQIDSSHYMYYDESLMGLSYVLCVAEILSLLLIPNILRRMRR